MASFLIKHIPQWNFKCCRSSKATISVKVLWMMLDIICVMLWVGVTCGEGAPERSPPTTWPCRLGFTIDPTHHTRSLVRNKGDQYLALHIAAREQEGQGCQAWDSCFCSLCRTSPGVWQQGKQEIVMKLCIFLGISLTWRSFLHPLNLS